jgi:hypothetical protein
MQRLWYALAPFSAVDLTGRGNGTTQFLESLAIRIQRVDAFFQRPLRRIAIRHASGIIREFGEITPAFDFRERPDLERGTGFISVAIAVSKAVDQR